jgi:ATP-dependent helicase/nuclease subunit B
MKASRLLRNAMIGWGRDRYLPRLKSLRASLGSKARLADEEGEPEQGERLRAGISEIEWLERVIRDLLGCIPACGEDGLVDLGLLCEGLVQLLKKHSLVLGEVDAEALGNLSARLSEAAAAARSKIPWDEAMEWLRGLGQGLSTGASGPKPGHLHVSSFRTGGFSGRPVTFLLGLDQGAFPGAGLQDPVLLDEEREKISAALPTTADALRENLFAMASLLSSLRGRVILSYSSYDIIDERQSFPSSLLLQVFRLNVGKPDLDYSDLLEELSEPSGMLPGGLDRVFDEIDWWLGKLVPGGRFLEGRAAVRAHFEELDRGILAADIRRSDLLTEFDGLVDASAGEFHPLHNPDIVMSATRLELLAGCPFAYFLNYILGISPAPPQPG